MVSLSVCLYDLSVVSLTVCLCGLTDGVAGGGLSSAAVHDGLPGQQSGLQPGLAKHGLHAVAELAAEHVVDEEVDGGVDIDAELLNVDEQVVGVVVLAAGAELWLEGQYSSERGGAVQVTNRTEVPINIRVKVTSLVALLGPEVVVAEVVEDCWRHSVMRLSWSTVTTVETTTPTTYTPGSSIPKMMP